jgi:hypothetical protein
MALYYSDTTTVAAPRQRIILALAAAGFNAAAAPVTAVYRAWTRYRTERILEGLPTEIRKDIGYRSTAEIDARTGREV